MLIALKFIVTWTAAGCVAFAASWVGLALLGF